MNCKLYELTTFCVLAVFKLFLDQIKNQIDLVALLLNVIPSILRRILINDGLIM